MIDSGFNPDPDPAVVAELRDTGKHSDNGAPLKDLRELLWSSIDNDDTRDLDQIEFAEELGDGDFRLLIGVADVDAEVPKGSAIDLHAGAQTTTVYSGAVIFPMIPVELSAGATSLFDGADRKSVVVDMVVGSDGTVRSAQVYRAQVMNKAQLAYSAVGSWLDSNAPIPQGIAKVGGLEAQVRLQARIAGALRKTRLDNGALEIE